MLTLLEVSDRLEIEDLLVAYCHALDFRRWDDLDDVFTADAVLDYGEFGRPTTDRAGLKEHLRSTMRAFPTYFHMVATSRIDLHGDEGTGTTICHNPVVLPEPYAGQVAVVGCWYHDRFVRTVDGWRISGRRIERCFEDKLPDLRTLAPATPSEQT